MPVDAITSILKSVDPNSNKSYEFPIMENGDTLTTIINNDTANTIDHYPKLHNQNHLNHWIDMSEPQNGKVSCSTKLSNSEYTLYDYKEYLLRRSFKDFQDNLENLITQVLKLLLYVEDGKEWYIPIDPLNIIYDSQTNTCRAFYREPRLLKEKGQAWAEDISKMMVYLCIPETNNSIKAYSPMDYSALYSRFLYTNEKQSDELLRLIKTYGQENLSALANYVYELIAGKGDPDKNTVKQLLLAAKKEAVINEVNADNEQYTDLQEIPVANRQPAVTLSDEQPDQITALADDNQEPDLSKMSPKERKRYLRQKKQEKQKAKNDEIRRKRQAEREAAQKAKQDSKKQQVNNNQGNTKQSKPWLWCLITALIVGGASFMYIHSQKAQMAAQEQSLEQKEKAAKNSPKNNSYFYNGILEAAANSNNASDELDEYFQNGGSQKDLSQQEITAVFGTYLKNGQYNKILENIGSDKTADALIKYLITQNDNDDIKKLNNSGNYSIVTFAKADVNNDYNKMVELANDVNLSDNGKYQNDLCQAFVNTNKLQEGKEWADNQSNSKDLINAMKTMAYKKPNANIQQINQQLGIK